MIGMGADERAYVGEQPALIGGNGGPTAYLATYPTGTGYGCYGYGYGYGHGSGGNGYGDGYGSGSGNGNGGVSASVHRYAG